MNFDLIHEFVRMVNVIFCLVLIIMVFLQFFQKKSLTKSIVILVVCLFILLILSLFFSKNLDGYIILLNLLILIYLLRLFVGANNSSTLSTLKNDPNQDSSQDSSFLIFKAKEQERSRIYANLHDDVGAKLLELIYTVKDDASKSIAKDVLSKIRQAVASTENIQCTVDQLVESLLHETQLRLSSANIALTESISINNPHQKLTTTMPMTLIRIVREVLNNIIKHAQAEQVEMAIQSNEAQLSIRVCDNGVGFDDSQKNGKGMQTIKKRAESISATTTFHSTPGKGTFFELKYNYANK